MPFPSVGLWASEVQVVLPQEGPCLADPDANTNSSLTQMCSDPGDFGPLLSNFSRISALPCRTP